MLNHSIYEVQILKSKLNNIYDNKYFIEIDIDALYTWK